MRLQRSASLIGLAAVSSLALAACSSASDSDNGANDELTIVATTTPLGSVTEQIAACAGGNYTTLMPVGADPHDFSASSAQIAALMKSDVVIANGLGLEDGLATTLDQVELDGIPVVDVAEEFNPLPFGDHDDHDHAGHEGHDHGEFDPHFWLDAGRMAQAAELIGTKAAELSEDSKWSECGNDVSKQLAELDGELRETLAKVPADKRVIVTDHDAFGYFNAAYGFESAGVVVPGGSTEAEPSSQDLAALAATIKDRGVPVIFSNTAVGQGLVDSLAREVGNDVQVVPLYVGSTGPADSPAADYQGMMRENARLIAQALS
ncbi:Periplasmic zinc-binding protein TroA precursor [Corynebacterium atrinae]|uniref:metal ABC transporter substrate-binding protein n=1 Tax=Corynebacterium atrinae TaxID=1336740 RepID=UPI0025B517D5|nr:metal ABC transporter substrate-binding protein [Corynebacterium atrinae]WJY63871.1 Periplasmic zinc-binding protein TroA precursor [Corynebacterium atrinae]